MTIKMRTDLTADFTDALARDRAQRDRDIAERAARQAKADADDAADLAAYLAEVDAGGETDAQKASNILWSEDQLRRLIRG